MAILSKEEILAVQDLPTTEVNVPEWGGSVRLKGMSAGEREALEEEVTDKNGKVNTKNIRVKLLVRSIVDENGEKLFSETDMEKLNEKSADIITRLFIAAQNLNGMSEAAVEDMTKNS
jgi:NTP pyrophosphatase (non-canonical NTP hydrolase)